jgi:hypothetical protein
VTSHEERVDELFRVPPEEFTGARDRLARELSDSGDRDAAKEVKALRRPTAAAWAVNAAVRRKPELVAALLEAADRLRAAQRRAASGLSAEDYRQAMAERRRVVRLLTEEADGALTEAGRGSVAHVATAARTFEAAASGGAAAQAVRRGRVSKELLPPSGFDAIDAFSVIPGAAEAEPAPTPKPKDRQAAAARRELAAAQRDVDKQTRRAATARQEARVAEREASDAEDALKALERDVDRARRRLEEARQAADRTRRRTEQAERALEEAEANAAELREATGAR